MTGIRKIDVAKQYLEDAFRMYNEMRFLSALTLAGAAEEMLGRSLEHFVPYQIGDVHLGQTSALNREAASMATFDQQLSAMGTPNFTPKTMAEIKNDLLRPRNSAKHFNDSREFSFEFDPHLEAGAMIIRAIANYRAVFPDAEDHYVSEEQDISADQVRLANKA